MRIGVPKEVKPDEYRVALLPHGVVELVTGGHQVYVERGAGHGVYVNDHAYRRAGAIVCSKKELYGIAELVVKVKEPVCEELALLHSDQILFAFLHLAAEPLLLATLIKENVTAIAFETVQENSGALPLLAPMSEIAGRMAPQVGAECLLKKNGGCGVLLGGVPGVSPAQVVIVGGGIVGMNAARIALGMGADVTMLDVRMEKLRALDNLFDGRVQMVLSNPSNLADYLSIAHLVIGAALIPGTRTPRIITTEIIQGMQLGSVFVDVSIDQGGCSETSRPTTHSKPTYILHDVVHYCVTNMPGGVALTATRALSNVTLPYVHELATHGLDWALSRNRALARGLNVHKGAIMHDAVKIAAQV
ncbi:MAG: alanine dehydrogenase [Parcubacteria group bacterium Gr01-1014_48]|nr:MAG: alanine dehydrogenase [Parcubacteria group bacterium Greene0416_14]TSC73444.1 MAG: alanine dehydrogenase [Parcubacteria group bacterium Gr01-1014_48]TSD00046.1 MAG: alanine dehydrogenase [Parcubacteria group bacterium Greene1014_15]TSD07396.1 MAG: alanine dehydrogenase [Parcubacteria group bacterium Greene0714_4]